MRKDKAEMTKAKERYVVVTTAHRGVFAGYASKTDGPTVTLRAARLCLYWSVDLKGFMGLASHGPNTNCKIGPPANIELRDITAVVECTDKARDAWERH